MPNNDELLTIKEVAEHFNISIQAVHKRIEKDNVKPFVVHSDNRIFLKKEILDAELFTYNDEEKIEKKVIYEDEEGIPESLNPSKKILIRVPLKEHDNFKATLRKYDCKPNRMLNLYIREFNRMTENQKEEKCRKAMQPFKVTYWRRGMDRTSVLTTKVYK